MRTLLTLAICLAAQQIAFSQQTDGKDALPAAPSYEGKTFGEWLALTKDKNDKVRADAASALKKFRPQAGIAVPVLVDLLKDKDEMVRGAAAYALGAIGPAAKTAIPSLTGLLKDESDYVRRASADALGEIGSEAKIVIPALTRSLKDQYEEVRASAAFALSRIGPDAKTAIPALTELLKDNNEEVRAVAAKAVGEFGPEAKTAIPALTELLKDKEEYVRKAAAEALEKVNPILPPAPKHKTWKLVWHDEFGGTNLDTTKWEVMPDAPRRSAWWMRKAVSLDCKGHLVISTLKEGDRYIDGCVRTKGKFEHSFGYYLARVRLQKQPGHWSAFWIMGDGVGKVGSGGLWRHGN